MEVIINIRHNLPLSTEKHSKIVVFKGTPNFFVQHNTFKFQIFFSLLKPILMTLLGDSRKSMEVLPLSTHHGDVAMTEPTVTTGALFCPRTHWAMV